MKIARSRVSSSLSALSCIHRRKSLGKPDPMAPIYWADRKLLIGFSSLLFFIIYLFSHFFSSFFILLYLYFIFLLYFFIQRAMQAI